MEGVRVLWFAGYGDTTGYSCVESTEDSTATVGVTNTFGSKHPAFNFH